MQFDKNMRATKNDPSSKKNIFFFKIKTGNCSFNEQFVTNNPSAVTMIISEFLHIHINNNQPTTKVSFFLLICRIFFLHVRSRNLIRRIFSKT